MPKPTLVYGGDFFMYGSIVSAILGIAASFVSFIKVEKGLGKWIGGIISLMYFFIF